MSITLTEEQEKAKNLILDFARHPTQREFKLGGFAGTGKTTLMKSVREELESYVTEDLHEFPLFTIGVAAFTGKAASVLRSKGLFDAVTIHSLMYRPIVDDAGRVTGWERKSELTNSDDDTINFVIIDEASMVSTELYRDLTSYESVKFLWVGDPGQLEPVGENPQLMFHPDYVLETIHRQAVGNPILSLADKVRKGADISYPVFPPPAGLKLLHKDAWKTHINSVDQMICAYNNVRHAANRFVREQRHFDGVLEPGERVICLSNNREKGVYNGQQFTVEKINKSDGLVMYCDLVDDLGQIVYGRLHIPTFGSKLKLEEQPDFSKLRKDGVLFFDYGYCITCHKSQGSEWDRVMVMEQWGGRLWDMNRWRYTAITRARNELLYCK